MTDLGATPGIAVVKAATLNDGGDGPDVGDTISYSFTVTNTGDQTLTNITISDPLVTVSGSIATLAPGASDSTLSATYTLTQSDIDTGSVTNQATATGSSPGNTDDVSDLSGASTDGADKDDATVTDLGATPGIAVVKAATLNDDVVSYSFTVTNTGDQTLESVTLVEVTSANATATGGTAFSGTGSTPSPVYSGGDTNANSKLDVTETWTYTSSYTLTQADKDAGGVSNQAYVSATGGGTPVDDLSGTDPANDTPTQTVFNGSPKLRITKTVDDSALDDGVRPGDRLDYTIVIENIGDVAVRDVTLVDTISDFDGGLLALDAAPVKQSDTGSDATDAVIAVGDVWTYTASYTLTADSIATGGVENIASVSGSTANGQPVTAESKVGGNTSDDGSGTPTDTGFPGEISGTVLAYQAGVPGVVVQLLAEVSPGVYEPVQQRDENGDPVPGQYVTTTTDADGNYTFLNVPPGTYAVEFVNSGSQVQPQATSADYPEEGNRITGIVLDGGAVEIDQDAFLIDPSGVVYDAETFDPVTEATVTLWYQPSAGAEATLVDNGWLDTTLGDPNPREITAGDNGTYSFLLDPTTAQDGIYSIRVSADGYGFVSKAFRPLAGPFDAGLGGGLLPVNAAAVPVAGMSSDYYLSFAMQFGPTPATSSNGVIQNHIPLDPLLLPEIEDDLIQVLEDDLAATMTQQGQAMSGYAKDALARLKANSPKACAAEVDRILQNAPIAFGAGSAELPLSAGPTLDRVAAIMERCEEIGFAVRGYLDAASGPRDGYDLSLARAQSVAQGLRSRGIGSDRITALPYRPDYAADDRAQRVSVASAGRVITDASCADAVSLERSLDADLSGTGGRLDGSFSRERRECAIDGWSILSGTLSHLSNDRGMDQSMVQLAYRRERFVAEDHLSGWFVGGYASSNDVTGLADGTIRGFGLNAGLYGAKRLESDLFLDYYLGAATGRHQFDLDFDRTGGTINASGHYDYTAMFMGIALSGQTYLGDYPVTPRVGLDAAWSPGGSVEVEASRGAFADGGDLRLSSISGLKLFAELQFEDLLPGKPEVLMIAPRLLCERPIGQDGVDCGYGLNVSLSQQDDDSGNRYEVSLSGEKTQARTTYGVTLSFAREIGDATLEGSAQVSQNRTVGLGMKYKLDF